MRRYKAIVTYDGSMFNGFQSQKNKNTIQDHIEQSLSFLNNNNLIRIVGASRTDAGVHANGQVIHFDLDTSLNVETIAKSLNFRLPKEIFIKNVTKVEADFHSRFNALYKRYKYSCITAYNPLFRNTHYFLKNLKFEKLKEVQDLILGKHDFSSFSKFNEDVLNTKCNITKSSWYLEEDKLYYTIEGDRFLHHMVRYLVGTMISVMNNKITINDFTNLILEPSKNTNLFKAPAHGLNLEEIYYE
jgi:tRNA pseudouridine38-40 synthase